MKVSKIKLLFNQLLDESGFIFLIGLFLSCTSIILFQKLELLSFLLIGCIAGYLFFLIAKKFNLKIFAIISILFFIFAIKTQLDFQQQKMPTINQIYLVNPDKVTINENFAYGVAKYGNQRISFSLKPNETFTQLVKDGLTFGIFAKSADIDLVKSATNPAEFDLRSYYRHKGIKYQVEFEDYRLFKKKPDILNYLESFRLKIKNYFNQLPVNLRFFVGQLFLGEDLTRDKNDIRENYRNLGVIHLLCISGLHVLLYTQIISILGSLFRMRTQSVVCLKIMTLMLLLFLSGFQPGITRATLGFLISYGLGLVNKSVSSFDRLALALIIHLFFVPDLLLNVGAQLSYLLVLGLTLTSKFSYWTRNLFLNLIISPILIFNFYELNVLTVLYNFIIVPIFNLAILPLTLIGLSASFIYSPLMNLCEKSLEIINRGIGFVGEQKIGLLLVGKIFGVVCLIFLIMVFMHLAFKQVEEIHYQQLAKKILFTGTAVLAINILLINFPLKTTINFIDIGQGDSVLITTPIFRKSYLIDTGGKLSFGKSKKKIAKTNVEKITVPFLKSKGIRKLDGVFVTHQDADHLGDLDKLLEVVQVKKIYFAQGMQRNKNFYRKIVQSIKQVKLVPLRAGQKLIFGPLKFHLLYPNFLSEGKNEDSLAMIVQVQKYRWFLSGDLDQEGEEKILDLYPSLKFDYFKLGHHGSKTSTSKKLLKQAEPDVGIISAGRKNRYGHPHQETLDLLKSQNVRFLNTAEYGMISWYYRLDGSSGFKTYLRG